MAYYPQQQQNRVPPTYMNQPYNPVPQQQMVPQLKGRPVASFDEVRATGIDFDGSVFFFPDLSNKRIYTKQIGMDGAPIYNFYELNEMPIQAAATPNTGDYVTRDEFTKALAQIREGLAQLKTSQHQEPQQNTPQQKEEFNF